MDAWDIFLSQWQSIIFKWLTLTVEMDAWDIFLSQWQSIIFSCWIHWFFLTGYIDQPRFHFSEEIIKQSWTLILELMLNFTNGKTLIFLDSATAILFQSQQSLTGISGGKCSNGNVFTAYEPFKWQWFYCLWIIQMATFSCLWIIQMAMFACLWTIQMAMFSCLWIIQMAMAMFSCLWTTLDETARSW